MKLTLGAVTASALVAFVVSLPVAVKRDVDPALVPEFGHQAGLNPTGTGDCDGITSCPPDWSTFLNSPTEGYPRQPRHCRLFYACACTSERGCFISTFKRSCSPGRPVPRSRPWSLSGSKPNWHW
ncbi:hypothetical protein AX17_006273 [Amanita inopinata Kibby_2008]|nr:hypothetical protein AX17_006273 [Amanita inopinata Kibby_2008]